MLKKTVSPKKLTFKCLKVGDNKIDRFNIGGSKKIAKKLRKSIREKLPKFWKLAKSKKLSKSGNLPKFYAKKSRSSFLTPIARIIFNCL